MTDMDRQIADAINEAFVSGDAYVLMSIAHALNAINDREHAFRYLKNAGTIK